MILPIVLVALLVVALVGAAMARTVLLQRRTARRAEQEQQSAWLADSALQRAQARLASDATYTGETWNVTADQMQLGFSGVAVIRIESIDDAKRIVVEAVYPEHPLQRILQRREKLVGSTSREPAISQLKVRTETSFQ
jgi:type II secretory pathway pseudopilin PulG